MIYLLLSVFFASSLFVILKYFEKYQINNFQAIVVNYFVAFSMGFLLSDKMVSVNFIVTKSWFFGSVILGILFITIFNVTALTAQRGGLSVASVAGKMSLVIPVLFGIIVYQESFSLYKFIGFILALLAVFLTSKKSNGVAFNKSILLLTAILFMGAGTIDTLVKYIEMKYVATDELIYYIATTFLIAGCIGIAILMFQLISKKTSILFKNIIGGIVLGVPNYFSLYFLIKALQHPTLESSTIFTINNVLIVLVTSLLGIMLFKEYLSVRNKVGILLSIVAILMFYL
ncbi:MAG: EamA family transporter [Flavobacteriaceae bacterium]|nr:EamA family transporter [Flavobacteriaceae bacterium]